MVGTIATFGVACVAPLVCRIAGVERSEPHRRPESGLDGIDNRPCARPLQDLQRQAANCKYLVWPECVVRSAVHVIDVEHIEEHAPGLVPEAHLEGAGGSDKRRLPSLGHHGADPQRIDPQSLNFDGLAYAGRDRFARNPGVHPCQ